ncbi:hypothetical protein [Steroidobacter cummioxidans]|uniref:hypothetical protein n=1 Tax=Steroidobacter cummioxidans TaxID=1803913 RepID=UPI000E31DC6C|nr:hypothetical protein [Steroidobacter cummioxidans]
MLDRLIQSILTFIRRRERTHNALVLSFHAAAILGAMIILNLLTLMTVGLVFSPAVAQAMDRLGQPPVAAVCLLAIGLIAYQMIRHVLRKEEHNPGAPEVSPTILYASLAGSFLVYFLCALTVSVIR